jgi:CubicO group peptidase (beta-lactamase class C family)
MKNPNELLQEVLANAADAGEIPGAATLMWSPEEGVRVTTAGWKDLKSGQPVERDTIFRIASLSKPVATVAALTMLEEGRFSLDDSIVECAPELKGLRVLRDPEGPLDRTDAAERPINFRDLLTHRSGLTYGDFHSGPVGSAYRDALGAHIDNDLTPDEWIKRLAGLPLIDQPGRSFHYGHSTDLLGFLMARLDHAPLDVVLKRRVFEPLGMRDTGFVVPHAQRHRCAAYCGFDAQGRTCHLSGAPGGHARDTRPETMTFQSAGQGLWSTLDDYLAFARTLIGRGAGPSLLRPETRALMTSNQLTPEQRANARVLGQALFARGHGYGMGVAVVTEPGEADRLRGRGGAGTVGWPGAYGSWWQADPNDGSVLIFLTHSMADLEQMAQGIGLGVWAVITQFHQLATQTFAPLSPANGS